MQRFFHGVYPELVEWAVAEFILLRVQNDTSHFSTNSALTAAKARAIPDPTVKENVSPAQRIHLADLIHSSQ